MIPAMVQKSPEAEASGDALPCELVSGGALVLLTSLYDGLLPAGLVHGIGEILGFQSNAGALAVFDAAFAFALQEIAGIELDAGAIGGDGQGAAAFRVGKDGAGIAEHFEIVVIAISQLQLLVLGESIPADPLGRAEIHGGADYAAHFPGGDRACVRGSVEPGGHGQDLVICLLGMLMTGQIEIAVVGHIKYGITIGNALVTDAQGAALQGVGHLDVGIAGEALVAMGAVQVQGDAAFTQGNHIPHAVMVEIGAAVEVVFAVVGKQEIVLAAQIEAGIADAVGIAANGGTQEHIVRQILSGGVIAQQHVSQVAVLVRHPQGYQIAAKIRDGGGDGAGGDGI